jgi:PTS system nitrogen regulatory IIA component
MDLKIKDVADLLNVSETTIRRWLAEGKIPAYRINNQYRFSRTEIETWVMSQKLGQFASDTPFQKPAHESNTHESTKPSLKGAFQKNSLGGKQFSLYRALHKGNVVLNVPGSNKEEIIKTTMQTIADEVDLDADVISNLLMEREHLQSTGIGNGIAIPHTRDYLMENHQDIVVLALPEKPVNYDAIDGKPVNALFFLFACEDKRHLHLLAKIAHLSSLPATVALLKTKPNKEIFLEYVKNWESNIQKATEETVP